MYREVKGATTGVDVILDTGDPPQRASRARHYFSAVHTRFY